MAKNFKNFSNGFRIKPLADPSSNVTAPSEGDVTFKTGAGLQIYADIGAGPGWQQLLMAGSEADSQLLTTKILNKSNTSSYQDETEGSPSADKIAIFYASSTNDSRYDANVTAGYSATAITEKTLILDMVSGTNVADVITQAYVYLPQGITNTIGQTYTVQRQDSYKQTYTDTNTGEAEASIRIYLHTDGSTQQQVNATGYTYQQTNILSGQELLDYIDIHYNCTKVTFMWNGTNWILLNSISDHKHMLPIGSVVMSVLTEGEFNWETAGIWKICDGGSITGSRLEQITEWTKTPDLVGSNSTTLVPSQTTYPNNRVTEPLVGSVDVATGVQVTASDNIVGSRIADSVNTAHLGLNLAFTTGSQSQTVTNSNVADGQHRHRLTLQGREQGANYQVSAKWQYEPYSGNAGSATSTATTDDETYNKHKHNIAHTHGVTNAQWTTKEITNSTTLASGQTLSTVTRPYTVLFNFFIRID